VDLKLREEEDVAIILAEQKRKDLERLEAELAAAAAPPKPPSERSSPTPEKAGIEKLGFLARKRAKSKPASPRPSADSPDKSSRDASRTQSDEQPRNILQGGGGAVPGTDAPRSAVNAGERVRVLT
jgi:hypothetical protein